MSRFTEDIIKELSPYLCEADVARLSTTCGAVNSLLKRSLTCLFSDGNRRIHYQNYPGLRTFERVSGKLSIPRYPPNLTRLIDRGIRIREDKIPPSVTDLKLFNCDDLNWLPMALVQLEIRSHKVGTSEIFHDEGKKMMENMEMLDFQFTSVDFIPPTLIALTLRCDKDITTEAWNSLPSGLLYFYLRISDRFNNEDEHLMSKLPLSLRIFKFQTSDAKKWRFEDGDYFNSGLKRLLFGTSRHSGTLDCKMLPKNLTSFSMINGVLKNLADLPKSLEEFQTYGNCKVEEEIKSDISEFIPGTVKRLVIHSFYGWAELSSFPKSLTSISFSYMLNSLSQSDISLLPPTLVTLEDFIVISELVTDFSHLVNLKKIISFTMLQMITEQEENLFEDHKTLLELIASPSLKHIQMNSQRIKAYPETLTSLILYESAVSVLAPKNGKRNKRILYLDQLPKSLTHLRVGILEFVGDTLVAAPNIRLLGVSNVRDLDMINEFGIESLEKVFPNLQEIMPGGQLTLRKMLDGNKIVSY